MVEKGSAIPLLSCVVAGALPIQIGNQTFFDQARDLVAQVIECKAASKPLPDAFPRSFLAYFNGIGRRLKEGESVELNPPAGSGGPVLTPKLRKELILHGSKTYVMDIDKRGRIEAMDFNNRSFRFRSLSGEIYNARLNKPIEEAVREACGVNRTWVDIIGQGVFNADEQQEELVDIRHLDLLPNQEIIEAFTALEDIQDGWLDGEGKAPSADHVETLAGRLAKDYPSELALPFVAAMPDGSIYLEWISPHIRTSAEFVASSLVAQLHSTKIASGESTVEIVDLSTGETITRFFDFIAKNGGTVNESA